MRPRRSFRTTADNNATVATFSSDSRPIISRGPSLVARFLVLGALSVSLMVADHRYHYLDQVRAMVSGAVYPLQWLVDAPFRVSRWAREMLTDRSALRADNARLTVELRETNLSLLTMAALREENKRLRTLGEAVNALSGKRMLAEIMKVDLDPLRHRVLLNKGQDDGVFKGQPVLDAYGIVGQITRVGKFTSEAILISDPEHATPVRVNRTGRRTIASGSGNLNKLVLPFLTGEEDIKVGDLLVTSGLGGVFPAGYPLGTVTKVERNPAETFATVEAKPTAKLDSDYEVVLLWYQPPPILPPDDAAASTSQEQAASSAAALSTARSSAARAATSASFASSRSAQSTAAASSASNGSAASRATQNGSAQ